MDEKAEGDKRHEKSMTKLNTNVFIVFCCFFKIKTIVFLLGLVDPCSMQHRDLERERE